MKTDAASTFSEVGAGLIPPDESVRAVIRVMPAGEATRRSARMNLVMLLLRAVVPARRVPIALEGTAARWPTAFAADEGDPTVWSRDNNWFFWLVLTDRRLHVIEGRLGKGWSGKPTAGPETASFLLDEVDEIVFNKSLISQFDIWFKDGSSIQLEAGAQKLDAFLDAIRPFERPGSARPRRTGWMPSMWLWSLGIALLVGGMAVSIGAGAEAETERILAERGEEAPATIVDVSDDTTPATLDVKFDDEFGLSAEASFDVCDEATGDVGDKITVIYNPDDTSSARAEACDLSTGPQPVLAAIGITSLAAGTFVILRVWKRSGWKRRRIGIPIALLGVMFIGAAVSEGFYYLELAYTGVALALIGAVAQFGRRASGSA